VKTTTPANDVLLEHARQCPGQVWWRLELVTNRAESRPIGLWTKVPKSFITLRNNPQQQ
jgi:hypothetical protein